MNIMTELAHPLLINMLQASEAQQWHDPMSLHRQFKQHLQQWSEMLLQQNVEERLVSAGQYCLCCAIDEAIMESPWGKQSIWNQQSLLSQFFQDTWGGERFYTILETMLRSVRNNFLLLELQYVLLSLGFQGKYFNQGQLIRDEIRQRLFNLLREYYEKDSHQLLTNSAIKKNQSIQAKKNRTPAYYRYCLIAGAITFIIGLALNIAAHSNSKNLSRRLDSLSPQLSSLRHLKHQSGEL